MPVSDKVARACGRGGALAGAAAVVEGAGVPSRPPPRKFCRRPATSAAAWQGHGSARKRQGRRPEKGAACPTK